LDPIVNQSRGKDKNSKALRVSRDKFGGGWLKIKIAFTRGIAANLVGEFSYEAKRGETRLGGFAEDTLRAILRGGQAERKGSG